MSNHSGTTASSLPLVTYVYKEDDEWLSGVHNGYAFIHSVNGALVLQDALQEEDVHKRTFIAPGFWSEFTVEQ